MTAEVEPEALVDLVEEAHGRHVGGNETLELPGQLAMASRRVVDRSDSPVADQDPDRTGRREGNQGQHIAAAPPDPEPSDDARDRQHAMTTSHPVGGAVR